MCLPEDTCHIPLWVPILALTGPDLEAPGWVFPGPSLLTLTSVSTCVSSSTPMATLSFHVGSDCHTPESYREAIADCHRVFEMGCKAGHHMSLLDLGGGFPGVKGSEAKFEEVRGMALGTNSSLGCSRLGWGWRAKCVCTLVCLCEVALCNWESVCGFAFVIRLY